MTHIKKIIAIAACLTALAASRVSAQIPPSIKCWQVPAVLADSARTLEDRSVLYDPSYRQIPYPNGDVPKNIGVCTDVIVRAFRKAFGWDLQKSVYEYRKSKNLPTNTNIDHRRVRNLMAYFDQLELLRNDKGGPHRKGNIIIWNLGNGQLHIGLCVDHEVIIHNICCGQEIESMYMKNKVIRNYTWRCPELEGLTPKEIYEKIKAGNL